MKSKHVQVMF